MNREKKEDRGIVRKGRRKKSDRKNKTEREREGGKEGSYSEEGREIVDTKKYKREIVYDKTNTDTNSSDNNHASFK